MGTVRACLHEVSRRLAGVTETPGLEAELLLTHVSGWTRPQLLTRLDDPAAFPCLDELVERRLDHEPIAYILGEWEFYSLPLAVEPPLLVPRPETEHLVEAALGVLPEQGGRVLELCTGTGCVALALAHESRPEIVWATDISPVAVRVAAANARRHGLDIQVAGGDLYQALPGGAGPFDVIVSNPPYVSAGEWDGLARDIRGFEDRGALVSGDDGLDCIRRIVSGAPAWLNSGGLLALEMGESQAAAVTAILEDAGFAHVAIAKDLAGHDRIASGRWPRWN